MRIPRSRSWQCLAMAMGVAVALSLLGDSDAGAQNSAGPGEDADTMFRRLDTDKDGKLSRADIQGYNRSMIERIMETAGKKSDGSVSREEFHRVYDMHRRGGSGTTSDASTNTGGTRAPDRSSERSTAAPSSTETARPDSPSLAPVLRWLDRDANGKVTRTEFNRLNELWERLDTNKDGVLDAAEMQAGDRLIRESQSRPADDRPATTSDAGSGRPNQERPGSNLAPRTDATRQGGDVKPTRLEGVWRGWIVGPRGNNESEMELTITGNRMEGKDLSQRSGGGNEGLGTGTFAITGNGASGNLDADGTASPHRGKHYLGIYQLDGDTLRWCISVHDGQRPRTLASGDGSYLMVLRKQATSR